MAIITQDKAKAYDPKTTEQRAEVLKGLFAVSPAQVKALSDATKAFFISRNSNSASIVEKKDVIAHG